MVFRNDLHCSWEQSARAKLAECLALAAYMRRERMLATARGLLLAAHELNRRLAA